MKHKAKLYVAALIALATLGGCDGPSAPTNLSYSERVLTWSEVRSATAYRVLINDENTHDVSEEEFTLPVEYHGELTFKVASLFGEVISEYSAPLVVDAYLTLSYPENIHQDGNILRWNAVNQANGYVVKVGLVENDAEENEFEIVSSSPVQVAVLANGSDDGYVIASPFSSPIWFKVALAIPTNISYSDGILSWTAVEHAASYQITIDDGDALSSSINQINVGFDNVGNINFKVKAISDDERYFDSAFGEANIQIAPLTLSAPTNVRIIEGVLLFDAVDHATSYAIFHETVWLSEVTETQYQIPNVVLSASGTYLQVQALSDIHSDSLLSQKVYLGAIELHNEADLRSMGESGYFVLASDIVLTSAWTSKDFQGVLDGNNHTISGLSITGSHSSNLGFFKSLDEATINNLTIEGAIDVTSTSEGAAIGGLAGVVRSSSVYNVSLNLNLSVESTNGIANVGGLAGIFESGQIEEGYFAGALQTEHAISGGLVGKVASTSSNSSLIINSGTEGELIVLGGEQSYAGGLIGLLSNNNAAVSGSRSSMNVSGTCYVGGLIAYMAFGSVSNCYSRGDLSASSAILVHAGGFVGRVEGYNNAIAYSIAMMSIMIPQTGGDIFVGSFSGVTPGGTYATIYDNCHYDSTRSDFDRIGNSGVGRGDGITGLSSSELLTINNYDSEIWSFAMSYPILLWEL